MIKKLLFIASFIAFSVTALRCASAVSVQDRIKALKTDFEGVQTYLRLATPGQEGVAISRVDDLEANIEAVKKDTLKRIASTGRQKDEQELQELFSTLKKRLDVAKRDVGAGNYAIAADVVKGIEAPGVLEDVESIVEEAGAEVEAIE